MNINDYARKIFQRTDMKVIDGPFKGMKVLPLANWGSGDLIPKLLGTYENELYDCLEEVFAFKPSAIINVGCAEGFYGVGCGLRLPEATVAFIDIDLASLEIARKNAAANGLAADRCTFSSTFSLLPQGQQFIFMDCEGAEYEYLDPIAHPSLASAIIIAEMHPFNRQGRSIEEVAARFRETHHVKIIRQGPKNPYIDCMEDIPDMVKFHLICENRPCTMYWLYMIPKDMPLYYYLNSK